MTHTDTDDGPRWITWFRTQTERQLFAELGLHAVVCAGQEGCNALRICATRDPRGTLTVMQSDAWRDLHLHDLVWAPDAGFADRIKAGACAILDGASRRIRGEWFDCPPVLAVQVIRLSASKVGCPILSHPQMLERVRSLRERRIERAVMA